MNFGAFISNGKELNTGGIQDYIELEQNDQVIQADECTCTNREHYSSCEIVNMVVSVNEKKNHERKYIVEMAFCKECGSYYIPQKSYALLVKRGKINHHIKGGVCLYEYLRSGEAYDEELDHLQKVEADLSREYNMLPKPVSRYAIDDGCGGLRDLQGAKFSAKKIYEMQDSINQKMQQPYIGRIDLSTDGKNRKSYYIGGAEDKTVGDLVVYSRWSAYGRAYSDEQNPQMGSEGKQVELRRKIDIVNATLRGVEDVFAGNTEYAEKGIYDKFLIQVLMSRKKSHQLTDILSTIQKKQNEIIERACVADMIVQGCAGSGKTMVMLHRLSFWLYNNKSLHPENIKILTPNENFNIHIGGLHSQLNLGDVEILSVDKYYNQLLEKYDKELVYDKEVDEEENVEERYLNYIYGKTFRKELKRNTDSIMEQYLTEDEEVLLERCSQKCAYKYLNNYRDSFGNRVLAFTKTLEAVAGKNNGICSERERFIEKIAKNRELKEKSLEFIAELSLRIQNAEENYKDVMRENINKELTSAMEQSEEVDEKNIALLKKALEILEASESIQLLKADFDSRKAIRENMEIMGYLNEYSRNKRSVLEQRQVIEQCEIEIANAEKRLQETPEMLNHEETEAVRRMADKYSKDVTLKIFQQVFSDTVKEKLRELDMEQPFKVYRCELYARVLYAAQIWNKTVGSEELVCVDEGQDVSFGEYECIYEQNQKNKAHYNVFGDLNQRIKHGRGLVTWEQLKRKFSAHLYELNENYRNTNQITQYCNEIFGFNMILTGVEGEPVRNISFEEMLTELKLYAGGEDRVAVILPRSISKMRVTRSKILAEVKDKFSTKFETNKISVMYVDEIKGIEFDRVYTYDDGLERNEKYIAYTRALDKLSIVH